MLFEHIKVTVPSTTSSTILYKVDDHGKLIYVLIDTLTLVACDDLSWIVVLFTSGSSAYVKQEKQI